MRIPSVMVTATMNGVMSTSGPVRQSPASFLIAVVMSLSRGRSSERLERRVGGWNEGRMSVVVGFYRCTMAATMLLAEFHNVVTMCSKGQIDSWAKVRAQDTRAALPAAAK